MNDAHNIVTEIGLLTKEQGTTRMLLIQEPERNIFLYYKGRNMDT